jgi:hypothetical protein
MAMHTLLSCRICVHGICVHGIYVHGICVFGF